MWSATRTGPGVHNWHARGRTNVIGALIGKELLTVGLFDTNVGAARPAAQTASRIDPCHG